MRSWEGAQHRRQPARVASAWRRSQRLVPRHHGMRMPLRNVQGETTSNLGSGNTSCVPANRSLVTKNFRKCQGSTSR